MTSFTSLRTRLLTVLGTGALAAITPHCGGSAETYGGDAGAGGKMGSGGVTAQGGTPSVGGASSGGVSSGGVSSGGVNSAGVAGFFIPPCPPPTMQCRTFAELEQCLQSTNPNAGAGGEGGAAETMDGGAPVCPIVQSFTCFPGAMIVGGPTLMDGSCCYLVGTFCGVGRPFNVEGRARTATLRERADWAGSFRPTALAPALRKELAEAWLGDALLEHASVAAFGRLSLELLALGAPAELLRDTHRAALDEIRHAELCFGLAARYADAPQGPGPIDVGGALSTPSLRELAVRAVEEGCVGETLGALVVQEQQRCARDPLIASALSEIADDEARHAELSWRIVRWAIEQGGQSVLDAVESSFRAAIERATTNPGPQAARAELGEHGRLDAVATSRVIERGLAEVVSPCAEALLSAFRA